MHGTLTFGKMAPITLVDTASFMEEIKKYDCIYTKFSKSFKSRYKRELLEKKFPKNSELAKARPKISSKTFEQLMDDS